MRKWRDIGFVRELEQELKNEERKRHGFSQGIRAKMKKWHGFSYGLWKELKNKKKEETWEYDKNGKMRKWKEIPFKHL